MILAVIGGIRGHLPALQAVIEELDREGIERTVCTGDLVTGFPWPNEVMDLLQQRGIPCVQGASDRKVVRFLRKHKTIARTTDDADFAALRSTYETLTSEHLEFLVGLPKSQTLHIDGVEIMLCHGSPANPAEVLMDTDEDYRYQRQREVAPAPIIVHGGTDKPHVRMLGGTLFVNPGALASNAAGDGRAPYALISTEVDPWEAEIRFATYDTRA